MNQTVNTIKTYEYCYENAKNVITSQLSTEKVVLLSNHVSGVCWNDSIWILHINI